MTITTTTVPISHDLFLHYWNDSLFNVFLDGADIYNAFSAENIKQLLKRADVNETEKEYGMNFLQKCILEDFSLHNTEGEIFLEIIQVLITAKIDLNHQDVDGCTALHLAVEKNQFDLVELLIEKGAIATIVDCEGKTAMDYAKIYDPSLTPELIKKAFGFH